MWLNSRDLSGDDDGAATRDGMWGFAGSSPPASHGAIGASGSHALWNRMEPAEEEREEEALPSYLSYLQPAFRPAPATASRLAPGTQPATVLYATKRGAPGLPAPSPPMQESVAASRGVGQVTRKSSELAQALEHLVLGTVQRHLGDGPAPDNQSRCRCNCDTMRTQMQEMAIQVHALQNQVLELTKNSIPTAIEVGRVNIKAPGQTECVPVAAGADRQGAWHPDRKPGKHSPVKHLVQTLRDEVDAKVQQATADLSAEMNAALGEIAAGKAASNGSKDTLSSNAVLAALAGEHEASLARLSGSFEQLLAEEARQRAALEARVRSQLSQQEEWLQQLEGAFGSPHDPEHEQEPRYKNADVNIKLAALERKCDESRELCKRLARLLPDAARSRPPLRFGQEDEEGELSWPGHMVGRG
ncbi:hypothetical protein GQ600_23378 [Phytophthora cactorum]|nr:hypothetical protein GQ600_23378 [Phytophthora cactorum]